MKSGRKLESGDFMDNYTYITTAGDLEAVGHELCDLQEDCQYCPVRERCIPGYVNGFIEWLKEEHR